MIVYTLQDLKEWYDAEVLAGIETRDIDEYIMEHFMQTYDKELNFIGWSLR